MKELKPSICCECKSNAKYGIWAKARNKESKEKNLYCLDCHLKQLKKYAVL